MKIPDEICSFLRSDDSYFYFQESWIFIFEGTLAEYIHANAQNLEGDNGDRVDAAFDDNRDHGKTELKSFYRLFKNDENLVKCVEKNYF